MLSRANVLDHPDAGDLVEARLALELAEVANLDAAPVGEAFARDALARERRLLLAQRDAERANAVRPRGVNHERAPAASDVEQVVARRQGELSANDIELPLLRLGDVFVLRAEIRAGVHH